MYLIISDHRIIVKYLNPVYKFSDASQYHNSFGGRVCIYAYVCVCVGPSQEDYTFFSTIVPWIPWACICVYVGLS
jgi:hypothetical protein